MKEVGRQLVHIGFGLFAVFVGLLFAKDALLLVLLAMLCAGLILVNLKLLGYRIPLIDSILDWFERPNVYPGKGALYHLAGVLLAVTFARDFSFGLALVAMLALGDGFSTIIGVNFGRSKLPWNPKKTFEGLIAFAIAASMGAYFLIGVQAFSFAIALALVETVPVDIDDNLFIPFAGLVIYAIATAV